MARREWLFACVLIAAAVQLAERARHSTINLREPVGVANKAREDGLQLHFASSSTRHLSM